jgi:uncharacterized YigZ family protein
MSYPAPAAPARTELVVKKSRFLGIVLRAASPDEASAALERLREEFPDATHHCWAYVLGDPAQNPKIRLDDDGEPAGTAGKPILNVLQHRGLGDVLLVVVRYFGGVKLGAGGLARAYSQAASRAVDEASIDNVMPRLLVTVRVDFADEPAVRRLLLRLSLEIESARYEDGVSLELNVPEPALTALSKELQELTKGRAAIEARPIGI